MKKNRINRHRRFDKPKSHTQIHDGSTGKSNCFLLCLTDPKTIDGKVPHWIQNIFVNPVNPLEAYEIFKNIMPREMGAISIGLMCWGKKMLASLLQDYQDGIVWWIHIKQQFSFLPGKQEEAYKKSIIKIADALLEEKGILYSEVVDNIRSIIIGMLTVNDLPLNLLNPQEIYDLITFDRSRQDLDLGF